MKTDTKRLEVRLANVSEAGSCNFCDDEVSDYGARLRAEVYVIRGARTGVARICRECLADLKRQAR